MIDIEDVANADFVNQLYRNFLGREPDASGFSYWSSALSNGQQNAASVTRDFLSSAELQTLYAPIVRLYLAAFNRIPDAGGFEYWIRDYRNGASLSDIAEGMVASEEFKTLYGQSSDEQFIKDLYRNTFSRQPDVPGESFWNAVLDIGVPRSAVIASFATSQEMLRTRSEEVDYILLHRAIFGEFPTREVVDAALPVTNWAALIEKLYESQQYDGVDVPGLDRYEPPAPEPEPQPEPEPEPEPDPGLPPDSTAPTILAFTVSSPSTLSVTSSESGTAGLYDGSNLIGSQTTLANANTSYNLSVNPQPSPTNALLKVADNFGNITTSSTHVFIGTDNNDSHVGANSTSNFIFGFDSQDTLVGGDGDDVISGGDDNDTLTGGLGNDTFLIDSSSDQITDLSESDVFIVSSDAFLSVATITGNYVATAASQNLGSWGDQAQFAMDSGVTAANFSAMTVVSEALGGVMISANSTTASTITGSSGADRISGSDSHDQLLGGGGNDTITGGAGADALTGGTGDDVFLFNTGDVVAGETIDGGDDVNTIRVVTSTDFSALTTAAILTAANIDNIQITDATTGTFLGSQLTGQAINVNGAAGGVSTLDVDIVGVGAVDLTNLTFTATGTGTAFVSGTDIVDIDGDTANNTITGTTLADNIAGNDGDDILVGGGGADTITGGAGADSLTGGLGADTIVYNTIAELFDGGALVDSINGSEGTDTIEINGEAGFTISVTDSFSRANSIEVIAVGGRDHESNMSIALNADAFTAGIRTVTLATDTNASGVNIINASAAVAGQDLTLIGSAGKDSLVGGAGNDAINGGNDSDTIIGSAGADTLDGVVGNDIFEVSTIVDFALSESIQGGGGADTLRFTAAGAISYEGRIVESVETLELFSGGANLVRVTQGSGLSLVIGMERSDSSISLIAMATQFSRTRSTSGADVDTAGEWATTSQGNDFVLTYWDESLGQPSEIVVQGVANLPLFIPFFVSDGAALSLDYQYVGA